MAGETVITIVGNLTADPELRYTPTGQQVVNFTIASTPRSFDRNSNEWKNGEALFLRASAWGEFAENITNSLTKGMRVIAQGRLNQRSYDANDGTRKVSLELAVEEIGPSLRYASASVSRSSFAGQNTSSSNDTTNLSQEQIQTGPTGGEIFPKDEKNINANAQDDPWASEAPL
jgi:single-strand DNA-binding protein